MRVYWIQIIMVAVLSAVCTTLLWKWLDRNSLKDAETEYVYKATMADELFSGRFQELFASAAPTHFIDASRLATPAVVSIQAMLGGGGLWERHRFSQSTGSGVIISPDGYIITNHHVIENGASIKVTLNDKKEYEAKVVGTDPSTDLALLKINAREVPFLLFGNSDSLQIGEWVLAVGNPFRLESTVTAGIVSAKGRNINILDADYPIESFIQTDAVVNPGNSGGALVNTLGELVGINTAIITQSGKYEGYSFAVPSNLAQKVIYDLMEFGRVQRGLLGVSIDNISDERARELLLPEVKGVQIIRVSPGGSADDGGMLQNDVITSINGVEVKSVPELQEIVGRFRPGDNLAIEYFRKGKKQSTSIILRNPIISLMTDIGFELRELTTDERREIGKRGVLVISINKGSKIDRTNMDPGFIITKVNNLPVESIENLTELLRNVRGRVVLEGVYKKYKGEYYYAFSMD